MKRSTSLTMCIFPDLLAAAIFYYISYQPLKDILDAIAARDATIEYNVTFFIGFGFFVVPTLHVIGMIETYLPRHFNRSVCSKVMWCSLIIPLIIGLGTANWVKQEILQHGYVHCEGADTHMKLAHFKVYVREMDTCRLLTMEKKNSKRAGLK